MLYHGWIESNDAMLASGAGRLWRWNRHGTAVRDAPDVHASRDRVLVDAGEPAAVVANRAACLGEKIPAFLGKKFEADGDDVTWFAIGFEVGDAAGFRLDDVFGDGTTDGMRRDVNHAIDAEGEVREIVIEHKAAVGFFVGLGTGEEDDEGALEVGRKTYGAEDWMSDFSVHGYWFVIEEKLSLLEGDIDGADDVGFRKLKWRGSLSCAEDVDDIAIGRILKGVKGSGDGGRGLCWQQGGAK